jgi:undecaprenyl-diphosphatase
LVGSFGIDIHHLRKAGMARADVVLDVQVLQTVSLVAHVLLLALAALAVRGLAWPAWHFERPQYVLAGALGLLLLSGLNRAGRRFRALPVRPGLAGLRGLRRVATTPREVLELLGGTLVLTAANVAALVLVLDAFGVALPVSQVLLAYLVAVTLGALSPTPGGVGAVEASLVLLFVVAGVDPGAAVCATLAFRLLTFWLPMLPGWRATRSLRRTGAL